MNILKLLGWQRIGVISGVVGLLCVLSFGWGWHKASLGCAKAEVKTIIKEVKVHAKTKQEIMRLPDPDLDQRLSRWLRD